MYPRNAASPQRIAIGPVVQISDGAVQTSGVSVKVLPQGTTASAGGGTIAYEEGIVHYTPTQAETNYASFILVAYKTGCIPTSVTVVTSASSTAGYAGLDWAAITAPTTTVNLSGTTVKTATDVETDTADIQSRLPAALVSGRMDASVGAMSADVLTSSALAASAVTEIQSGLSTLDAAGVRTAVGLASANMDTQLAALPTAAENADAVWDEAISGHLTSGTTGASLNASGSAGDPWSTTLPGASGSGTAGYIVGTNINATVGSRSTLDAAGVRTAVGLASANLDTQLADLPTATENADALLNRDMSAVSDTNARSPLNALRAIRNKWGISGTTYTVRKEDDSTTAWTAELSSSASADPVTGSDPA